MAPRASGSGAPCETRRATTARRVSLPEDWADFELGALTWQACAPPCRPVCGRCCRARRYSRLAWWPTRDPDETDRRTCPGERMARLTGSASQARHHQMGPAGARPAAVEGILA